MGYDFNNNKDGYNKYVCWGLTAFCVLAAGMGFYYLIFHMQSVRDILSKLSSILTPVLNGILMAYFFTPLLNAVEHRFVIPNMQSKKGNKPINLKAARNYSIFFTMVIVLSLGSGFCAIAIPQIYKSVMNIYDQYNTYLSNFMNWIDEILSINPEIEVLVYDSFAQYSSFIGDWINTNILSQLEGVIKSLSVGVIGILSALLNLILGFIISIYLLSGKDTYASQSKKIVYAFMDTQKANTFIKNVRFAHRTFIGFFVGKIIDSIIIGIICFIGLNILKIDYAGLISLIIGITNVIPYFGPFIGAIPSGLLILMMNPKQCLYFIIFILVLQQFDGNILGPKILGEYTGISSFWVIFAITVGGGIFGVFGMFIGVPVFAVFYAGLRGYLKRRLNRKGLTASTEEYYNLNRIDSEENYIYEPQVSIKKGTIRSHVKKLLKRK